MLHRILLGLAAAALVAGLVLLVAGRGGFGSHRTAGRATLQPRRPAEVAAEATRQGAAAAVAGAPAEKQILFGDLHAHTTFSLDAFYMSLPLATGEGAHPPADACDFARFCSALDFWSINDHAEGLTPAQWQETIDSIRQCNAVGQDPAHPDTVAFLGWEWTQAGAVPEQHWGHKNVVLADLDPDHVPARPIASGRYPTPPLWRRGTAALAMGGPFHDLARLQSEIADTPECRSGVPERELPRDCIEVAATPAELFAKLDDWGFDSIVIPHGTAWGAYTPQGSTWDKQLVGASHDEARQTLLEIYSGHGNSEELRDFGVERDADGAPACPEPRPGFLPTCWRAGEIILERCRAEGAPAPDCEARAAETRRLAARAGAYPHMTVPGTRFDEWLDAGQCRDCFQPAFNYRPGGSAQYILALSSFETARPRHFRFGLIASSDSHFARPGTGYKELGRIGMTDSMARGGAPSAPAAEAPAQPRAWDPKRELRGLDLAAVQIERVSSYLYTGGLVAVHASGRDRRSIWDALQRREVYGTSGPRILLWFELLNAPGGGSAPMGAEVALAETPRLRVRAVGSLEQLPGCPDDATSALGPERLARLCKNECYHPSDARRKIARIEVVRIRPQQRADEAVTGLVEDPWRRFECPPDPAGCTVEFEDPEFTSSGRDALYYARAIEEPKPLVNGVGIRVEDGRVLACPGPDGAQDDCLAPAEPRAWSSPIWVDVAAPAALAP